MQLPASTPHSQAGTAWYILLSCKCPCCIHTFQAYDDAGTQGPPKSPAHPTGRTSPGFAPPVCKNALLQLYNARPSCRACKLRLPSVYKLQLAMASYAHYCLAKIALQLLPRMACHRRVSSGFARRWYSTGPRRGFRPRNVTSGASQTVAKHMIHAHGPVLLHRISNRSWKVAGRCVCRVL